MVIELNREARQQAIASIERCFSEELDIEFHEDAFQYWRHRQAPAKPRR